MTLPAIHHRLLVGVAALAVLTAIGMVLLWPRAEQLPVQQGELEELVPAEVVAVRSIDREPDPVLGGSGELLIVTVEPRDGPDAGDRVDIEVVPEGYPDFAVGDTIELDRMQLPGEEDSYFIVDFRRLPTLGVLFGVFVLAVLVIGRWHGLRSLLGLGLSLLIVVRFIVPAILAGQSPPLVALVGSLAVMIVTLYLTHGVNEMTTSAVVGTGAALLLTIGLASVFVDRAKITGYASDDANLVRFAVEGLDLQGLVLAGLIIATLGVLDDVTISQASTVFALHDTDRGLTWRPLFLRAMKVGRDHIASVVNTLFLAYAGASLLLLVLFSTSGLPFAELVSSEIFAEEIVKIIIGSLGLIAAVPFTTALAASVAVARAPDAPRTGGGHTHVVDTPAPMGPAAPRSATRPPRAAEPTDDRGITDDLEPTDDPEERARRAWARYLREQGRDTDGT